MFLCAVCGTLPVIEEAEQDEGNQALDEETGEVDVQDHVRVVQPQGCRRGLLKKEKGG